MTEKRFYYTGDGINRFSGVIDYDTELSVEETVGILNELEEKNKKLKLKNDELEIILADILLGVKRDNYFKTGEIIVSINPDSYDMISDVLRKYGALEEWYE